MVDRRLLPLIHGAQVGAPLRARDLELAVVSPDTARRFVAAWHSRLPKTQAGPWKLAFAAHHEFTCFGAALWHNPSSRGLPNDWLELRRLAVPDDAPPHTASWMLGAMARWVWRNMPDVDRLFSYQDVAVHRGTIYRAAGWSAAHFAKPRQRDRSKPRIGTRRAYRSNLNGIEPDAAGKVRWEKRAVRTVRAPREASAAHA